MTQRSNTAVGDDGAVTGNRRGKKAAGRYGIEARWLGFPGLSRPPGEWRIRGWHRTELDRDRVLEKLRQEAGNPPFAEYRAIEQPEADDHGRR